MIALVPTERARSGDFVACWFTVPQAETILGRPLVDPGPQLGSCREAPARDDLRGVTLTACPFTGATLIPARVVRRLMRST